MPKDDRHYTPLDIELQTISAIDWPAFVQLVGEEAIQKAKVCILLRKGNSYQQIANKLQIAKHQVEYMCNRKCQNFSDNNH